MTNFIKTAKVYFTLTKPRLWFLLVYTGLAGYLIGGGKDLTTFAYLLIALISATAGANSITSYIDLDIDRIMRRTRGRPLPAGLINPPFKAVIFGSILISVSLVMSYAINVYVLLFNIIGLVDNIAIYSYLTKRRTYWNIVLGSFSGGCPTIGGYAAATGYVDLEAIMWAGFIVAWTPVHIWSLALFYRDDYAKAGVPMLPVVFKEERAIRCIASTALILVIISILLPILYPKYLRLIYYAPIGLIDGLLLYYAFKLLIAPDVKTSWRLFKITSPYLGIVFTVAAVLSIF